MFERNVENWMDLYDFFSFNIVNLSPCMACNHKNVSEQNQIYFEMEVPPDGSSLAEYVEENINESYIVQYRCEDGCQANFQAEKQTMIKTVEETEFIILLLRRSITSQEGVEIVANSIVSTKIVNLIQI